ncbi:HIT family protein [Ilumatobacter coccineus]|uniref:HIT family protein n=1 Tax=Ilumatobacter coccineus (strain NBRC 103263 / KCTC 29153 / YM16-304) TaxID=1313172 RepID=A0A6C7E8T8_ILUCY|nr:HIT family protein [Ilumatobacter coccineus]BAN02881.1 HIT family protein [Ilumatobacter coccineus YM16-304]
MATVFTMIINGDIPGTFLHRDEHCVVFMSINPMAPGHALVVPIEEIDHWIDASDELSAHLFAVAHRVAKAQERAFGCEKVGMIIAGYEVPHTHIHLIPTNDMSQLSFANAAASVDRDDLEAWADAIRNEL